MTVTLLEEKVEVQEEKIAELERKTAEQEKKIKEQELVLQSVLRRIDTLEEGSNDDTSYITENMAIPFQSSPGVQYYQPQVHLPSQTSMPQVSQHHNRPPAAGPAVHYKPFNSGPSPPSASSDTMASLSQTSAKCLPIKMKENNAALPSSAVNKESLKPACQVLLHYPKLQTESKVSKLAVKLARESFFGEDVMAKCTVMGFNRYPALPIPELAELKQTLFALFPKYWANPILFEKVWKECAEAIGQACKRVRADLEKKTPLILS